jgi:hypothetical protein
MLTFRAATPDDAPMLADLVNIASAGGWLPIWGKWEMSIGTFIGGTTSA